MVHIEKQSIFSAKLFFILLFFLFTPKFVFATDYTDIDNTASGFGGGTQNNTQWDAGNSWLEMDATGQTTGFATFTSRIIDSGTSGTWSTLSWVPQRPLMKELPDNNAVESGYTTGSLDMSSNVLLFHLNESSGNPVDTSGSGISGTVGGSPQGATGKLNTAFNFNGSSYINLGDVLESSINGTFSISVWVYPTAANSTESILGKYNSTSGKRQWMFRLLSSKPNITIYGALGGTPVRQYTTTNTISLNDWHHLVFVGDVPNDTYTIYVDGIVAAGSKSSAAVTSISDSNEPVMLGGLAGVGSFHGKIDELAVFGGRNLTADEVLNMYKRAALRARYQIRSCNDSACSGESFVGPGSSTSEYFEEQDSNTTSLPSRTISALVADNQYFQYLVAFETISSTLSPEIKSVTVSGPTAEAGSVPEFSDLMYVFISFGALFFVLKVILPKYQYLTKIFKKKFKIILKHEI